MPTRVIDVGEIGSSENPRLLQSKGQRGSYVALSHCWGGDIPISLRMDCVNAYERVISWETLPANFQDAITVTKNLGYRYLWIDSLCIIQDSPEDWESESKLMCTLHRDAVVTICVLLPRTSLDGFLLQEEYDNAVEGAILPVMSDFFPTDGAVVKVEPFIINDDLELAIGGFLRTRGWTMQESVLSERKLLYGRRHIYLQCHEDTQSSDGVPHGTRGDKPSSLEKILHSSSLEIVLTGEERGEVLLEYLVLVAQYSQRSLTIDSDKLPAFSGISQALHKAIGGQYLAGLWDTDFNRGLLWRTTIHRPYRGPYRAPSWSWAATNSWLEFPVSLLSCLDTDSSLHLCLLEANAAPKVVGNPFGEITEAFALVEARAVPLIFLGPADENNAIESKGVGKLILDQFPEQISSGHHEGPVKSRLPIVLSKTGVSLEACIRADWGGEEIADVDRDDIMEHGDILSHQQKFLAMLVNTYEDEGERWSGGVLLKQLPDGAYKRLGIFELQQDLREMLQKWPLKTLKLV